ncbi:MAG TPA: hypothetical protein IAD13_09010 [Bacteroidetes bacterium]|nr:hypothetical protein [Candidatus Limimorpha avicola]
MLEYIININGIPYLFNSSFVLVYKFLYCSFLSFIPLILCLSKSSTCFIFSYRDNRCSYIRITSSCEASLLFL